MPPVSPWPRWIRTRSRPCSPTPSAHRRTRPWPAWPAGAAGNPSLLAGLIDGLGDDHAVQVTGGRAVLTSARLPQRIHRLAQRRLDGLSQRARHLLVTATVLGPAFRLEDAAEMLGETPATLLPAVEEAMDAAIMTAAEHAFAFRHQLLRRAVGEMIRGRPARRCTVSTARSCSPGANRRLGPPSTCSRPRIRPTARRWPRWTPRRRRRCARRPRPRPTWCCARWS